MKSLDRCCFNFRQSWRLRPGWPSSFWTTLRELHGGLVALEPRHASWFEAEPAALLRRYEVARVAADPARVLAAAAPGGWNGLRYWRQHGSPRRRTTRAMTRSMWRGWPRRWLKTPKTSEVWCVFDNTALGEAIWNAAEAAGDRRRLSRGRSGTSRGRMRRSSAVISMTAPGSCWPSLTHAVGLQP